MEACVSICSTRSTPKVAARESRSITSFWEPDSDSCTQTAPYLGLAAGDQNFGPLDRPAAQRRQGLIGCPERTFVNSHVHGYFGCERKKLLRIAPRQVGDGSN